MSLAKFLAKYGKGAKEIGKKAKDAIAKGGEEAIRKGGETIAKHPKASAAAAAAGAAGYQIGKSKGKALGDDGEGYETDDERKLKELLGAMGC